MTAREERHGLRWLTAQAIEGDEVLDRDRLRSMRRATTRRDMRLGVHLAKRRLAECSGPWTFDLVIEG